MRYYLIQTREETLVLCTQLFPSTKREGTSFHRPRLDLFFASCLLARHHLISAQRLSYILIDQSLDRLLYCLQLIYGIA
jgi:hypothetical protein